MSVRQFSYVHDGSDGWLIVHESFLTGLGLTGDSFGPSSGRGDEGLLALHGGRDMQRFLKAWQDFHGYKPTVVRTRKQNRLPCHDWPSLCRPTEVLA